MATQHRTDRIDLRISTEAKQALQAAAMARQTSVSDFVLASALRAADEALAEVRARVGTVPVAVLLAVAAAIAVPLLAASHSLAVRERTA